MRFGYHETAWGRVAKMSAPTQPGTIGSLITAIETVGRKAFEPTGSNESRAEGQRELSELISRFAYDASW